MKKMIAALAFALSVCTGLQSASAQTKWDLANEYPPNSVHAQTVDTFVAALEKASNGEIDVTAHHGASLGYKSVDQFDAVGDGAIQLASSFVGGWAGIDPVFLVSSLPFLAPTTEDTRALYEASRPYYEKVLDDANQVFLLATPWPPSGLWGDKPLDSMEAIKGVRIRTYDANGTVTLREAGASPIQLSWADTVPQLTTNGIDGVLTSADGGAAAQLWEHQTHFTEVNYASPLQIIHINKDIFEALTDAEKEAVRAAAKEAEDFGWGLLKNRVQENYAQMKEHGMTVVTGVSPDYLAALGKAAEPSIAEWKSKFPENEALLSAYEEKRK
ncbi:TRAP transporter substrate-binding protein [Aureimonas glaciei]|jgi:TRAP-type C4-dicarboxylate transport system substrate-binding protein|uniref:C4-dicarboxylate ABC transporter n=1 Tax=Aureimonas glaciei TaxID=1776957 RepID=A0A916XXJ3_9HYPH|nr:TRAP transporter substrate-binding protein [Aureimonas glaciei]GGD19394.1 C4-dicarboxylate ABC transporter [Aureimonas glaciei]